MALEVNVNYDIKGVYYRTSIVFNVAIPILRELCRRLDLPHEQKVSLIEKFIKCEFDRTLNNDAAMMAGSYPCETSYPSQKLCVVLNDIATEEIKHPFARLYAFLNDDNMVHNFPSYDAGMAEKLLYKFGENIENEDDRRFIAQIGRAHV